MRLLLFFLILGTGLFVRPAPAAEYTAQPGPYEVGTLLQTWRDGSRNRDIPVKIYFPKTRPGGNQAAFPVIIFSHGLGGSREGYAYLGGHWASCGYVSVHLQHHGSDKDLLKGLRPLKNLREAVAVPVNATNRPRDVVFAIDRLTALNADDSFPLHGQLDLKRLGVAGHSFGAFTTMAVAGARLPVLGDDPRYPDPRVKAAIAMSTPNSPDNDNNATFDEVRIPVFHMTGTRDDSSQGGMHRRRGDSDPIVGDTTAGERLRPFRHTKRAPAYLLVFEGGDHQVFSGRLAGSRATDPEFQARVLAGSTAFWDAWLKDDASARQWLEDGGFAASLGRLGTFELNRPESK